MTTTLCGGDYYSGDIVVDAFTTSIDDAPWAAHFCPAYGRDRLRPALKQTNPPINRRVRFAFKVSKIHVMCVSLDLSHLATFFLE